LFKKAKELEYSGKRNEAQVVIDNLVFQYPDNDDFALFQAQLFAFDGDYKTALKKLHTLNRKSPSNYDVLFSLCDVSRWIGQYDLSLSFSDSLQKYHPKDIQGKLKRVLVYEAQQDFDRALKLLSELEKQFPENPEVKTAIERIKPQSYKNQIGGFYFLTVFNQFDPWHFGGIDYLRKNKKMPWRIIETAAQRYDKFGNQLEVEAFPRISKKTYFHLGLGISNNIGVFPDYRSHAEVYQMLAKKFEVSIGFRHLNFNHQANFVYTASLGKYIPNNWFYYRIYATFNNGTNSLSHLIHFRHYLKNEDSYLAGTAFTGANPMYVAWLNQLATVNTKGVSIDYQRRFGIGVLGKAGFIYELEEYLPNEVRNRFTFMLSLSKRF